MRKILIFSLFFLIFIVILSNTGHAWTEVTINYSAANKTIELVRGCQDVENTAYFLNDSTFQQNYIDSGCEMNRIWVQKQSSATSRSERVHVIPMLSDCQSYDFTNLTLMVQKTLDIGMTPYVSISYAPDCNSLCTTSYINDACPPKNYKNFTEYAKNITQYLFKSCSDGAIEDCGNFSEWRFEIWNEALYPIWLESTSNGYSNYTILYNMTFQAIKNAVPSATVGSVGSFSANSVETTWFFRNISNLSYYTDMNLTPDFFGIHSYDTMNKYDFQNVSVEINRTYYNYIDFIKPKCDLAYSYGVADCYNFEYNMDFNYPTSKFVELPAGASWLASALYYQLLSGQSGEALFYVNTRNNTPVDFGMYFLNGTKKPYAVVREEFNEKIIDGEPIYNNPHIFDGGLLYSTNDDLVVVNQRNITHNISWKPLNRFVGVVLYNSSPYYADENGWFNFTMDAFEVGFMDIAPKIFKGSVPYLIQFSTYAGELHRYAKVVRVIPAANMTDSVVRIPLGNLTEQFSKYIANPEYEIHINIHNGSCSQVCANYSLTCSNVAINPFNTDTYGYMNSLDGAGCLSKQTTCDEQLYDNSTICAGQEASWTYCLCGNQHMGLLSDYMRVYEVQAGTGRCVDYDTTDNLACTPIPWSVG